MASSPGSPPGSPPPSRPLSAMMRPQTRTNSRMSMAGNRSSVGPGLNAVANGSRASDEDGKTSVKVAIRIRPPLRPTDPGFELIPQRFQRPIVQVTSPTNLTIDSPQGRKLFVFDRVFGEDVNQEGIWDYLTDSITHFVQGYNVSMLAYGQSGAGKSYTMGTSGPAEQGDMDIMGVIPRAGTALFEKLEGSKQASNRNSMSGLRAPTRYSMNAATMLSNKSSERNWKLKATYVEIYNESLRDLLLPESTPAHERGTILIREESKGHIFLTGLREVDINSVEDLMAALNFGSMIRQTDSTAINAQSSRSHAVFSLRLIQHVTKTSTGAEKRFSVPLDGMSGSEGTVKIDSKLHFVDLAGSERLKNTGAQGERAKEGISINAGLASLGKVISQLAKQGTHISYRDSKLTRLLSDSLGGSAITYMIACVTPAEFHLSETLNTLQYAQRTRAIQSKPKIQQTSDESDKNAIIERLKAEIAFLQRQCQSERAGGERRSNGSSERPDRSNDREVELQNQLLDHQENYNALSQRHAKLISELAKARDEEQADNQAHENSLSDNATDRLNRSNAFAEAVEKVVLEYESTIQSLEQSLSLTRSSLSNIETDLLEKESKCAYTETINTQLQARLQKMLDRESSTEHYLHDLEAKLDGHTSGEEKHDAMVSELKKEIARARENEANCEDYISTLEERLAEAEQDQEVMQREIDRLEHVVERQRSLGKLDNLLYELDHIQKDGKGLDKDSALTNGTHFPSDHSRQQSVASRRNHQDMILETEDEDDHTERPTSSKRTETEGPIDNGEPIDEEYGEQLSLGVQENAYPPQSPAQSRFVEDKLENVTQELFDLKVEHESTLGEFDLLNSKYEEALRTLAELQDAVDESRHPSRNPRDSIISVNSLATTRPVSFLPHARVNEQKDGQFSSSRSLSSELSLLGESNAESSDAETFNKSPSPEQSAENLAHDENIAAEVEHFKQLAHEREQAQHELAQKYTELEGKHLATLDQVEDLKTQVSKAKMMENSTARSSSPVIRRKSSQNVMIIDKAHRAFASLRSIADENLTGNEDTMQNFDLNWTTAMHELHARSERVQELEADVAKARQDMDEKMRMINGLTRERSSMKATPLNMSVMSTLKDQLDDNEKTLRSLREAHEVREKELLTEIEALKTTNGTSATASRAAAETVQGENDKSVALHTQKINDLEELVASTETQHRGVVEKMQDAHDHLQSTIVELEKQLATHKKEQAEFASRETDEQTNSFQHLQREVDEHKAAVAANIARIAQLEDSHSSARQELDEVVKSRDSSLSKIDTHKSLISRLEQQIVEHGDVVKSHQDGMNLLQQNHSRALEELATTTRADHEAKLAEVTTKHQESVQALQTELSEARNSLTEIATQVAVALGIDASNMKLQDKISELLADQKALTEERTKSGQMEKNVAELSTVKDSTVKELEEVKAEVARLLPLAEAGSKLKAEHATLSEQLAALVKEKSDLEIRNKKNSRLVEELEDQLATNFDQHQIATNRLSTLQTERHVQLEEANAAQIRAQGELQAIREEYASLQAKLEEAQINDSIPARSNSNSNSNPNANLRKSASVSTLPSPPPAIPLPPLPGNLNAALASTQATSNNNMTVPASPTTNRPQSHEVKMYATIEDQEARIRTIEKHLMAEKQLTNTLEEALTDLERQSNKVKADCDAWRRRAGEVEQELKTVQQRLKSETEKENRLSMLQVEEERKKRQAAEVARQNLEERMNAISKKKKKGSLNCF